MAKDPRDRLHDVADLRLAIEGAFDGAVAAPAPAEAARPLRAWHRPASVAVAVIAALLLVAVGGWLGRRPPVVSEGLVRFFVRPTADRPLAITGNGRDVAISPDGRWVVYNAARDEDDNLMLRALDDVAVVPARQLWLRPVLLARWSMDRVL